MLRLSLALLGAGLIAGTSLAQPYPQGGPPLGPPPGQGWNHDEFWRGAPESPRDRIQFLQDRIDRAARGRMIAPEQVRQASVELDRIRGRLGQMHHRDGGPLDDRDRAVIEHSLDDLSHRLSYWTHRNNW